MNDSECAIMEVDPKIYRIAWEFADGGARVVESNCDYDPYLVRTLEQLAKIVEEESL